MKYQVIHRTVYRYSGEVSVSQHVARLTPRTLPHQRCASYNLTIEPMPAELTQREDYFGNTTTFFALTGAHRSLTVTARSEVVLDPRSSITPAATPEWEDASGLSTGATPLPLNALEFIYPSELVPILPALGDYALPSFPARRPLLEAVLDLTARIHTDFAFDPKATTIATPLDEVISKRRGVCQDFAHVQIGCLRALGLPARYVSGYIETRPPPGKVKLVGSDASHAWVQVFIPDSGWVDIDPTNNMLPSDRHIILAVGRDYSDVSPIQGIISGGGKHTLHVGVDIIPTPP